MIRNEEMFELMAHELADLLLQDAWISLCDRIGQDVRDHPDYFDEALLARLRKEYPNPQNAPDLPGELETVAKGILVYIEATNGNISLPECLQHNALLGGHRELPNPKRFAACLGWELIGAGIGWSDDHPRHNLELPHFETDAYFLGEGDELSFDICGVCSVTVPVPKHCWRLHRP